MQNPAETTANELISSRLTPIQQVQLQLGLNALVQDDLNLAVRCTTGAQSQLAADWLQSMLRHRLPTTPVQVCGPREGHELIEAFNQALTPQTLSQAHQTGIRAPSQLWLVREDCFERPADLTLMARLLQSFPGTPIRVIFLLAAATGLPSTPAGERSYIHTLTLDDRRPDRPDQPVLPAAMAASRPDASETALAEPATLHAPLSLPATADAPLQAPDLSDVVPGEGLSPAPALTAPMTATHRLTLGVTLAVALVGGLTWWSQQASPTRTSTKADTGGTAAGVGQAPGASELSGPGESAGRQAGPMASTASIAIASVAPTASSSADTATGSVTAAVAGQTAAQASGASVPAAPSSTRAASTAHATPASAPPSAPATAPVSTPALASMATPADALPGKVRNAHRWLSRLPEGAFVVEHSRHDSLTAAQRSTSAQSYLKEARILAVQEGQQTRFVVVTGPFRSADRVSLYMRRLQLGKARSHKASTLLGQLRNA